MSFERLPTEILENILTHLDGASLCTSKRVCKTWQTIINHILSDGKYWRKICIKEIPEYIIEELLANNDIPPRESMVCWLTLYRKWHKSNVKKDPHVVKSSIEAYLINPITCMKVSGSYVLTGHNNGYLCSWDQESGKLDQEYLCHLKTITDIVLIDQAKLGTYHYKDEFFWSHHHIVTVSKDCIISVKFLLEPLENTFNDLVLNKHSDCIVSARIYGDMLLVHSRDNTISLWKVKTRQTPFLAADIQFVNTVIGPSEMGLSVGIWHDQLFCISQSGALKLYNMEDNWTELNYFKHCWGRRRNTLISHCYNFRDKVIVLLTVSGDMIISIGEEHNKMYPLVPVLKTSITCVALKGTILALGGENGLLYLFHVPNNRSLMKLSTMTTSLSLSDASILAIDILYDIYCPIVVCSTTNSIYIVKLHKSGTSSNVKVGRSTKYFGRTRITT